MTVTPELIDAFRAAAERPDDDLARAALVMARLEFPRLDPQPYLDRLDAMGARASEAVGRAANDAHPHARILALNRYLFDDERFAGNREHYDDLRNSFLNEVLDRRTGIPITLALVYMEVARRAGVPVAGVNFPGHFLLRVPPDGEAAGLVSEVIIDPFHGGALLSETDCRQLLRQHIGDEAAFDPSLLAPASRQQILTRMLVNLKRIYVHLRSFPQARDVTELILALDPDSTLERRDRGLLSYQLRDYAWALRDLERYLELTPAREAEEAREEHDQIWEHVKALRRRVAGFN